MLGAEDLTLYAKGLALEAEHKVYIQWAGRMLGQTVDA